MTTQDCAFSLELSRRKLLAAAGIAAVGTPLIRTEEVRAARAARSSSDLVATPPVAGLHPQFGADGSSEIVVSWHTQQPVRRPRVLLERLDGRLRQTVAAKEVSYTDAKSRQVV